MGTPSRAEVAIPWYSVSKIDWVRGGGAMKPAAFLRSVIPAIFWRESMRRAYGGDAADPSGWIPAWRLPG